MRHRLKWHLQVFCVPPLTSYSHRAFEGPRVLPSQTPEEGPVNYTWNACTYFRESGPNSKFKTSRTAHPHRHQESSIINYNLESNCFHASAFGLETWISTCCVFYLYSFQDYSRHMSTCSIMVYLAPILVFLGIRDSEIKSILMPLLSSRKIL